MPPTPVYDVLLMAACTAAMEDGLEDFDEIRQYVLDTLGTKPVAAFALPDEAIDVTNSDEFYGWQAKVQTRVASCVRGTYVLAKFTVNGDHPSYRAYMADGNGLAAGITDKIFLHRPTETELVMQMLVHEIHLCKKAIDKKKLTARNVALLAEIHVAPGQIFDRYYDRGIQMFRATVAGIDAATGQLDLILQRKSDTLPHQVQVGAFEFAENAGIETTKLIDERRQAFPLLMSAREALREDLCSTGKITS